ncbi:hypothetical protein HK100_008395 [Physocladia obscura]|uniref:Metaxin glutathione S-transferase domain-containing protein n=1 Tax=Physocladia obscura TaxID=109957 RepID=A0AAD5T444_9FUNG|nr:hypothetical protein HK100_008395 [Physocladia obscura]
MMLDDKKELVNEVYLSARDVFAALNDKLGDQLFFFGDKPTTLDAVAYAHLSLHALPLLTNPKLNAILTFNFPKLSTYILRMKNTMILYPAAVKGPTPPPLHIVSILTNPRVGLISLFEAAWTKLQAVVKSDTAANSESGDPEMNARIRRKQEARVESFYKWASVIGAVGFFVGFVISQGIVKIVAVEEEEGNEDNGSVYKNGNDDFAGGETVIVDENGNVHTTDNE